MKRFVTVLLLMLLLLPTTAKASGPYVGHSLSFGGIMGVGALLPVGAMEVNYDPSYAYGFSLQYTYMANEFFGFTTGANLLFLNSSIRGNDVVSTYTGVMNLDAPLYITSMVHCVGNTTQVTEDYRTSFLEIPALLAIHNGPWYYNMGLKLGVQLKMNANYEYSTTNFIVDEIYRTGTYLESPLPQPSAPGGDGSYDPMINRNSALIVSWCMEIGYNFEFSDNSSLGLGMFLDYGLNDASLKNTKNAELLTLNGRNIEGYNGALNSNMMESTSYYVAGLRVLFNFGFTGSSAQRRGSKRLL